MNNKQKYNLGKFNFLVIANMIALDKTWFMILTFNYLNRKGKIEINKLIKPINKLIKDIISGMLYFVSGCLMFAFILWKKFAFLRIIE